MNSITSIVATIINYFYQKHKKNGILNGELSI